jgi:hypothetical protein
MAISYGPKLGLLYNSLIDEAYYDSLRLFLQAIDALVQASVISSSVIVPPPSPNPGDAYLLITGTPSGAWAGHAGAIAVWDAQFTLTGTNTVVPTWTFLTPQPGWIVWNVALASLIVYNGTAWVTLTGGANFPTNTNITSMVGIPNTTINSTGYIYNDSTNPVTALGDAVAGGTGPNGFQWGSGTFLSPTASGTVIIGTGPWTGLAASGTGIGIVNSTQSSALTANGLQTSGVVTANVLTSLGPVVAGQLQLGAGTAGTYGAIVPRGSANVGIQISGGGVTTLPVAVLINSGTASPTSGVGMLGFDTNYPTQTTIGANGAASALTALPVGYLQISIHGTEYVIPYYNH